MLFKRRRHCVAGFAARYAPRRKALNGVVLLAGAFHWGGPRKKSHLAEEVADLLQLRHALVQAVLRRRDQCHGRISTILSHLPTSVLLLQFLLRSLNATLRQLERVSGKRPADRRGQPHLWRLLNLHLLQQRARGGARQAV